MDHRQQSTGRAWIMICQRVIVGLVLFQLTTAGQLALKGAVKRSAAVAPLILGTIWFGYVYSRAYTPLMEYISLASIERNVTEEPDPYMDPDGWGEEATHRYAVEINASHAIDASPESGVRFINPNLISP